MQSDTFSGIVGVAVFLGIAIIALACLAFWLWMLIHAITNKGLKDTEKLLWVLLIVFVGFLGPILYFFIGKPKAVAPSEP
jgi:hypothetical protein